MRERVREHLFNDGRQMDMGCPASGSSLEGVSRWRADTPFRAVNRYLRALHKSGALDDPRLIHSMFTLLTLVAHPALVPCLFTNDLSPCAYPLSLSSRKLKKCHANRFQMYTFLCSSNKGDCISLLLIFIRQIH